MKKLLSYIILLAFLTACNDDVFLKPLTVEPQTISFDWTGGTGEFKANQDIDYVYAIVFRWVNGKGLPLDEQTMQYTLDANIDRVKIANDLCDITLAKDNQGRFTVESGYNLFADTVYMNIDISTLYETATRGLRILPSPGFGHGAISYDLNQCWNEESCDTINLLHLGFFGEEPRDFTVAEKGKAVARSAVQFKPYNRLLSDNIFGRKSFEVDEVVVNNSDWWLSGKKIPYTSTLQRTSDSLVIDEDIIVRLQPHTEYRVKAIIRGERYGFNYELPAISPVADLPDKAIEGVFWISKPLDYEILIETNEIRKQ